MLNQGSDENLFFINSWLDLVRAALFMMALMNIYFLVRHRKEHHVPCLRSKYLRLVLFFWLVTFAESMIEGIILDFPFGPRLVLWFVVLAVSSFFIAKEEKIARTYG